MQERPMERNEQKQTNNSITCHPVRERVFGGTYSLQARKKRGFTLVEIIVTLVILAILAAILIPAMVNWIDKAKEKSIIVGCRTCVTAAQTLSSEQYGVLGAGNINVTPDEVLALAKVPGQVSGIEIDQSNAVVLHLTYTDKGKSVTYCGMVSTCSHPETYNFEDGSGGGGNNDANGFYVGDTGIRVNGYGELENIMDVPYGYQFTPDAMFYYNGDYYYFKDQQYYQQGSSLEAFLQAHGVKVNTTKFATSAEGLAAGDLKLVGDKVYVFTPYGDGPWGWDVFNNQDSWWKELQTVMP